VIYDAIVVGLGGMGSAVLARCALRGARVLGIERFGPVHDRGASSGQTRMIRQAYYEDPAYVPLLLRAYELWRDLEQRSGEELLRITGLLMVGMPDNEIVAGSARTAGQWNLPVEYLTTADVRARFPMLSVLQDEVGVFERNAGVVFPERAIRVHLDLARQAGAETRFQTPVARWSSDGDVVMVELSDGAQVRAHTLLLTMGPWLDEQLHELGVPFEVQRNVQVWFTPQTRAYDAGSFPSFLLERDGLPAPLYGFPDFGSGVKAAFHGWGELTDPDELHRDIDRARDVEPVAAALASWMPGAAGTYREGKACMYALTPDRHFIVDRHPSYENVVLLGGFSGHGFKFSSAIGEVGADLALDRHTRHDIAFLSLHRFKRKAR
jgi:sarcosine oxidase